MFDDFQSTLRSNFFASALSALLACIYVFLNDRALKRIPKLVQDERDHPWTTKEIRETATRMQEHPVDIRKALPPRTGRRYIITGGVSLFRSFRTVYLIARVN